MFLRRLSPKIPQTSRGPSAQHYAVFPTAENDSSTPRPEKREPNILKLYPLSCVNLRRIEKEKSGRPQKKTCLDSRFRSHEMIILKIILKIPVKCNANGPVREDKRSANPPKTSTGPSTGHQCGDTNAETPSGIGAK